MLMTPTLPREQALLQEFSLAQDAVKQRAWLKGAKRNKFLTSTFLTGLAAAAASGSASAQSGELTAIEGARDFVENTNGSLSFTNATGTTQTLPPGTWVINGDVLLANDAGLAAISGTLFGLPTPAVVAAGAAVLLAAADSDDDDDDDSDDDSDDGDGSDGGAEAALSSTYATPDSTVLTDVTQTSTGNVATSDLYEEEPASFALVDTGASTSQISTLAVETDEAGWLVLQGDYGQFRLQPTGESAGNYEYIPNDDLTLNAAGTETFTYNALDADGNIIASGTVTFTWRDANSNSTPGGVEGDASANLVEDIVKTNEDTSIDSGSLVADLNEWLATQSGGQVFTVDGSLDGDPNTYSGAVVRDADGDAVTFSLPSATLVSTSGMISTYTTTSGMLVLNTRTGEYTYTPNENASGADSIVIEVTDGAATLKVTLVVGITAVNDAPTIAEDHAPSLSIQEDNEGGASVEFNTTEHFKFDNTTDPDADSGDYLYSVTIHSLPEIGNLLYNGEAITDASLPLVILSADLAQGSSKLTYDPGENNNGDSEFTYTLQDSGGLSSPVGTVKISVAAVNDAPSSSVAVDGDNDSKKDDLSVSVDESTSVNLTSYNFSYDDFGYSDPEAGSAGTIVLTSLPTEGTLYLGDVQFDETTGAVSNASDLTLIALSGGEYSISGNDISKLTYVAKDSDASYEGKQDDSGNPLNYFTFYLMDEDSARSDSDSSDGDQDYTMTINIKAMNDAPTAANTALDIALDEDNYDASGDSVAGGATADGKFDSVTHSFDMADFTHTGGDSASGAILYRDVEDVASDATSIDSNPKSVTITGIDSSSAGSLMYGNSVLTSDSFDGSNSVLVEFAADATGTTNLSFEADNVSTQDAYLKFTYTIQDSEGGSSEEFTMTIDLV